MMKKSELKYQREWNLEKAKGILAELKKDIGFLENAICNHGVYPYWMRDMEDRVAALRSLAIEDIVLSRIENGR